MRKMDIVRERGFSVEMASKDHMRSLKVSDESRGKALFEGNLGELQDSFFQLVLEALL